MRLTFGNNFGMVPISSQVERAVSERNGVPGHPQFMLGKTSALFVIDLELKFH